MGGLSIKQAAERKLARIRRPEWADRADYLKLDYPAGSLGPWLHLYSRSNGAVNGRNPVDILYLDFDMGETAYEPYLGRPSDDETK